jgi:hypothetical protein
MDAAPGHSPHSLPLPMGKGPTRRREDEGRGGSERARGRGRALPSRPTRVNNVQSTKENGGYDLQGMKLWYDFGRSAEVNNTLQLFFVGKVVASPTGCGFGGIRPLVVFVASVCHDQDPSFPGSQVPRVVGITPRFGLQAAEF